MKRALSLLLILLTLVCSKGIGQNLKIATVDLEYVYANLPSYKKLLADIDSSARRYQIVQKEKLAAYQQKLQALEQLGKQTPEPVLKDKTTELETLQASMQEFQANSDRDLRTKYASRFPEIEKMVKAAIAECAKELQVTYVARHYADYNAGESASLVLYSNDTESDLTDHILLKLGVANHAEKGRKRKNGIIK